MAPTFGLFIVGDEILSGKRLDKHLAKIIELLAARGLGLRWAHYLPDDRADITAALQRSFAGGDIVFSTGGIGATPDDHTRQAAAQALGVGLELHPTAERLIRERIAEMNGHKSDRVVLPVSLALLNVLRDKPAPHSDTSIVHLSLSSG